MKTLGAKLTFTLSCGAYTTTNPHFAHMTRNILVFSKQCLQWHPEILNGLVSALLEKISISDKGFSEISHGYFLLSNKDWDH